MYRYTYYTKLLLSLLKYKVGDLYGKQFLCEKAPRTVAIFGARLQSISAINYQTIIPEHNYLLTRPTIIIINSAKIHGDRFSISEAILILTCKTSSGVCLKLFVVLTKPSSIADI